MKCRSVYCDREGVWKRMCRKHYERNRRGENINLRTLDELSAEERFLLKVKKNKVSGCWMWMGHARGNQPRWYGRFDYKGKVYSAHRFAWELYKGEIPKGGDYRGICVCHKCDNTLCVNPKHLFIATHQENMQDKIEKGRCGQKSKMFCRHGHMFSEGNTWISKVGSRHCRTCHRQRGRKCNARKRVGG
jgi:hypothetical protein